MAVKMLQKLRWLGHDSFLVAGPPTIYFDPWRLPAELPKADLVLVSHEHGDHCSPEDVKKVSAPGTLIVANQTAAPKLQGDVRVLHPGEEMRIGDVTVQAVPAYNITKFRSPGVPFHPRSAQHNGYIVTLDGERIYFAGDTDHIPEMAEIQCDIALVPVGGTYTMTAEEAAEAVRSIQPKVAVPMHYGPSAAGTPDAGTRFKELCPGEVLILQKA
jgi:L-ascorbate metabolism protein UlaG (beta-lactamase superfamily)